MIFSWKPFRMRKRFSLEEVWVALSSKELNENFDVKTFGARDGGKRRSNSKMHNGGNGSPIRC